MNAFSTIFLIVLFGSFFIIVIVAFKKRKKLREKTETGTHNLDDVGTGAEVFSDHAHDSIDID
jgi:hypothetical protein